MLHRRDAMIRLGQAGLGALTLPGLLQAEQTATARLAGAKAKSCILLYLWGGPPQQDMWDLKPEAPDGIRSEFKPIDTVDARHPHLRSVAASRPPDRQDVDHPLVHAP